MNSTYLYPKHVHINVKACLCPVGNSEKARSDITVNHNAQLSLKSSGYIFLLAAKVMFYMCIVDA